ncbi:hypothetical protein [Rarobacter faecitabidus]|uniref:Uncharacterized protein n=1 Tax=Rarobacter faecitabidus TaxID=13243 RepID=A0A542ZNY2_RARFA|nr:hypothetical protein [Rarobacter faecitabidus]TQL62084.1 hypothetical protein FB461_1719 [Rarobacter faecitabidus]
MINIRWLSGGYVGALTLFLVCLGAVFSADVADDGGLDWAAYLWAIAVVAVLTLARMAFYGLTVRKARPVRLIAGIGAEVWITYLTFGVLKPDASFGWGSYTDPATEIIFNAMPIFGLAVALILADAWLAARARKAPATASAPVSGTSDSAAQSISTVVSEAVAADAVPSEAVATEVVATEVVATEVVPSEAVATGAVATDAVPLTMTGSAPAGSAPADAARSGGAGKRTASGDGGFVNPAQAGSAPDTAGRVIIRTGLIVTAVHFGYMVVAYVTAMVTSWGENFEAYGSVASSSWEVVQFALLIAGFAAGRFGFYWLAGRGVTHRAALWSILLVEIGAPVFAAVYLLVPSDVNALDAATAMFIPVYLAMSTPIGIFAYLTGALTVAILGVVRLVERSRRGGGAEGRLEIARTDSPQPDADAIPKDIPGSAP